MKNWQKSEEQYDVIVIGAGPAGLMAAGKAAASGAKVLLLEKNTGLGKKLLITGKGRCNLTQAEFDDRELVKRYGPSGKFLFSSFASFGPRQVIDFFEHQGLPTKIERGSRVFPVSDNADDIIGVFQKYLTENKVKIKFQQQVISLEKTDSTIQNLRVKNLATNKVENLMAKNYIICTGGKSYPMTGATGDGYAWARSLGHTITPPFPCLVPIKVKENWVKNLQGLSLKNVTLSVYQDNKKQDDRFGEMIFTHFGVSGPMVLDLSKKVGQLLKKSPVWLEIDFKPALDFPKLDKRLQRDFETNRNKDFINYLPDLVPQKMIETVILLSGIEAHKKIHTISKNERKKLLKLLKNFRIQATELMGFNHAIVTSGGVNLKEVDSKTMKSKIIDNLFFAGEILDLDGPTGGFNLQICWSTGAAAGLYATQK